MYIRLKKNSILPKSILSTVYFKPNLEYIGKQNLLYISCMGGVINHPSPIVCNSYCAIFSQPGAHLPACKYSEDNLESNQSLLYHGGAKEGLSFAANSCYDDPDNFWWFPPSRVPTPICRNYSNTQI